MRLDTIRIALILGAVAAVFALAAFLVLEVKGSTDSPLHIRLVPMEGEAAVIPNPINPPAQEPQPATSGQAVGYAFYSPNPRAQTTDLSIIAHRVPVIVDWVDGEEFEAVFRWPAADDDWQGSTAYHAIAVPSPPGSPDLPAGYESQHSVELSGVRYEVLIGQAASTIGTELMTLTWSTN